MPTQLASQLFVWCGRHCDPLERALTLAAALSFVEAVSTTTTNPTNQIVLSSSFLQQCEWRSLASLANMGSSTLGATTTSAKRTFTSYRADAAVTAVSTLKLSTSDSTASPMAQPTPSPPAKFAYLASSPVINTGAFFSGDAVVHQPPAFIAQSPCFRNCVLISNSMVATPTHKFAAPNITPCVTKDCDVVPPITVILSPQSRTSLFSPSTFAQVASLPPSTNTSPGDVVINGATVYQPPLSLAERRFRRSQTNGNLSVTNPNFLSVGSPPPVAVGRMSVPPPSGGGDVVDFPSACAGLSATQQTHTPPIAIFGFQLLSAARPPAPPLPLCIPINNTLSTAESLPHATVIRSTPPITMYVTFEICIVFSFL